MKTASPNLFRSDRVPTGFIVPALVFVSIVLVIPSVVGTVFTFSDWQGFGSFRWIGLGNYTTFFSDPQSGQSIINTVVLAVVLVSGQNVLGLALALAMDRSFRGHSFLQALFLMPVIISPIIVSYLWQYIYSPDGALNAVLSAVGLGDLRHIWLGDASTALAAIAVTIIWQNTGSAMVIYLAGLRGIPPELTEAASLDGATRWQRLTHVKLPLLAPAITVNLVLSLINALRTFDQVIAMTNGGPGYATDTLATVIYKRGFGANQLSYGLTMAVILAVAIAILATLQTILLRRRELAVQ